MLHSNMLSPRFPNQLLISVLKMLTLSFIEKNRLNYLLN
ncbi:hypothetical protein FM106_11425 [Brachybacterium faecium]|nr:hypothetical protein FM106_11425 [Brachybacterium faecium]